MYKINEIVEKVCLSGEKFMLEMHLRQPGFTYSVCEPFIENNIRIQKLKKRRFMISKKLHNACFQYDMTYGGFICLARRTASDKILLKIRNMMDVKEVLL